MKKLLFQSDDYGITDAVSDGILFGIQYGIVKNTGLFVNMGSSKRAAEKIKKVDVCLGIDINMVAGKPISDPKLIPHLVDEEGMFITSREQISKNKLCSMNGIIFNFEKDPYPYEEVLLETENQLKKFIELTGRLPEYFHPHSLCTENTERAANEIAKKYGIYKSTEMMKHLKSIEEISMKKGDSLETQLNYNVIEALLNHSLPSLKDGESGYYICHCGYADEALFQCSSLTLRRIKDLGAATSLEVKEYLKQQDIQLITYRDLK